MQRIELLLDRLNVQGKDKKTVLKVMQALNIKSDITDDNAIMLIGRSLVLIKSSEGSLFTEEEREKAIQLLERMKNDATSRLH